MIPMATENYYNIGYYLQTVFVWKNGIYFKYCHC